MCRLSYGSAPRRSGTALSEPRWTYTRLADGDLECRDETRVRAILQGSGRNWWLFRVSSLGALSGSDHFHSMREAKRFLETSSVFRPVPARVETAHD